MKIWAYSSFMVVVCLIVPGLILAGWAADLLGLIGGGVEMGFAVFLVFGIFGVLADMWRRPLESDEKIWWSVLVVLMFVVFLPLYWFRFVRAGTAGAFG